MGTDAPAPRVVRAEDVAGPDGARLAELTAAVVAILTVPPPALERFDALAVLIGQGEDWRLRHAIGLWESAPGLRRLLVADGNPAETTYVPPAPEHLHRLGLRRLDGVHVQPEPSANTAVQAAWIAGRVRALDVRSVALVVSPYHLPRAYLTVLRALGERGPEIPLVPVPVPVAPHLGVPETGADAYELVPGELLRMLTYADRGWIATPAELRAHLQRLWTGHRALLAVS